MKRPVWGRALAAPAVFLPHEVKRKIFLELQADLRQLNLPSPLWLLAGNYRISLIAVTVERTGGTVASLVL